METTTYKGEQMTPPKGYKHTELGVLPEDWEVVRLGDVVDFFSGGTPKTTERKYYGGEIPFIKSAEIYNSTTQEYLTQLGFKESSAKWVKKGDLLYALYGANSGEVAISKIDGVINQAILCIKNQPEVLNTYFLYSVFLEKKEWITTRFLQGGQGNLSGKIVQNLQISLPPLAEQEKIAEILSAWDTQIQNFETLITEKQALKKGLCQTLLTAKTRFKGFIEDWQVVRLGEVCEMKKGEQLNKIILDEVEGYPVINGGILPSGFTSAYNTFPNTITISEGGNSCGFVNYIQEYFWSGGHCYTLQNLKILDMFLFQVLKHNEKKIQMLRVGSGLPNIQKRDLEKFSISIPSKIEQEKIAEILSEADNEITLLEQKLQSLEIQKKGLMQILLSGKVRVKWN